MESQIDLGGGFYIQILILVASLLAVAFFSSSEASLISVNKFRIKHLAEKGNQAARAVERVVGRHEKFFATILLTENAFIILATSVGTAFAIGLLGSGPYTVAIATVAMTLLVVVFGEITPKSLAAKGSEKWSLILARPIEAIMALQTPVIFFFTLLPRLILRLMGGARALISPSVTEGELRMLIDMASAEGMVEHHEAEMLQNVFRFGDRQVREIMTPRTEIIWVEKGTSLRKFLDIYAEHYHTRFPIYEDSVDNVMGILSVKDVALAIARDGIGYDSPVAHIMRPAYFVPETKTISSLFDEMRRSGNQMAMVADEFGGVAGLVTLKQLIEQVVGRVGEEGREAEEEYEAIDENTFQVDGGMTISDANEELGLGLPYGGYETVAGFVLESLGRIPRVGEHFHFNGLRLEVTEMSGLKIERVTIARSPSARETA